MGIEFGEKLLYKRKSQAKADKINPRWEYGVFVGVRARSGELWIATLDGRHHQGRVRALESGAE